ncbi:MAG: dipeptidyl-peptidase-4, partial [Verrucomicrobia bacterium]
TYAVGRITPGMKPEVKRFDLATGLSGPAAEPSEPLSAPAAGIGRPGSDLSARGAYAREHTIPSPDGTRKAFTRANNIYLAKADGSEERAVTTDGSGTGRIRNGVPTYVYTEELAMGRAIWWSPDGTRLAYMRFDESKAPDYPLQMDQTRQYSTTRTIAYPSPGSPNPEPALFIYDLVTGRTTAMDARAGLPFSDEAVGHYLWAVAWAPDVSEIRLRRTNRAQNTVEWIGCAPVTGVCRTIVHEEHKESWATLAAPVFLSDGNRFIQKSDRNGWDNFYLYDLSGRLIRPLTAWTGFEVGNVVRVDEAAGVVWYMARDGGDFMKMQLHRVGLDGKGDVRLTDPAFNHAVSIAPDGKSFVDTLQTHDTPPSTRVVRIGPGGRTQVVAEIARSDLSAYDAARLKRVEMFTFTAADGKTPLQAMLSFPHDFDAARKYPVLVSIYGGPETNEASEVFQLPDPLSEFGFLVLKADLRSASGRGKAFINAIYGQVGQAEVDDQAQAVKALWSRPYVDKNRVGIFGTSYGGSMAAWSILRYPEVYAAAVSNSPVTDHRLYDSIYSERYMGLLPQNAEGYARTSAMTYAANLKGALLIYYGTADDNVHPKNALSLIQALQKAGKHFEVQVGPDLGHTSVNQGRMMEFFIENLVLPPRLALTSAGGAP